MCKLLEPVPATIFVLSFMLFLAFLNMRDDAGQVEFDRDERVLIKDINIIGKVGFNRYDHRSSTNAYF